MGFLPAYHERNMKNIAQLGDKTKAVVLKVYAEAIKEEINILIYSTIRTIEEQKANVAKGVSKTMRSFHLVGMAFDAVLCDGTDANWSGYSKADYKKFIAICKKNGLTWGGDWDNDGSSRDETFIDSPHFQYGGIAYGKDTFKTKGKAELPNVVAKKAAKPVAKPAPKPVAKTAAKPQGVHKVVSGDTLSEIAKHYDMTVAELKELNGLKSDAIGLGQILKVDASYKTGVVVSDVWLHKTADADKSSQVRVIKAGEKYRIYGEKNDMYNVGSNAYVSKKYIKI